MYRRLRIDVIKGNDVVVFVNRLGRNFSLADLAENAVVFRHNNLLYYARSRGGSPPPETV